MATTPDRPGGVGASVREGPVEGRRFGRGELEPETEEHLLEEYEGERPGRRLHGAPAVVLAVLGAGLSLFAIYWVSTRSTPRFTGRRSSRSRCC